MLAFPQFTSDIIANLGLRQLMQVKIPKVDFQTSTLKLGKSKEVSFWLKGFWKYFQNFLKNTVYWNYLDAIALGVRIRQTRFYH